MLVAGCLFQATLKNGELLWINFDRDDNDYSVSLSLGQRDNKIIKFPVDIRSNTVVGYISSSFLDHVLVALQEEVLGLLSETLKRICGNHLIIIPSALQLPNYQSFDDSYCGVMRHMERQLCFETSKKLLESNRSLMAELDKKYELQSDESGRVILCERECKKVFTSVRLIPMAESQLSCVIDEVMDDEAISIDHFTGESEDEKKVNRSVFVLVYFMNRLLMQGLSSCEHLFIKASNDRELIYDHAGFQSTEIAGKAWKAAIYSGPAVLDLMEIHANTAVNKSSRRCDLMRGAASLLGAFGFLALGYWQQAPLTETKQLTHAPINQP